MKALLSTLFVPLLATTLLAQTNTVAPPPASACGTGKINYTVRADDDSTIPEPAAGRATVVLIEDQLETRPGHGVCVKCAARLHFGLDGQWIAATHGFSHTSISVAPGDHHFCVSGSGPFFAPDPLPSMFGLQVEAGKTYFLSARLALYYGYGISALDFSKLNEDQGRYMVSISKRSVFTRK